MGAPGPGSPRTGLSPWGGDLAFETWDTQNYLDGQLQRPARDVDLDPVAVLRQRDHAARRGLRRRVADRQPAGAAREPSVGDQGAGPAESLPLQEAGRVQHLLHAGTAAGPFVPDEHHVAGLDLAAQDALDRGLLALEDLRRAREAPQLLRYAGRLHDRALGSQVAVQHGEAAVPGVSVRKVPDAPGLPVLVEAGPPRVLGEGPDRADSAGGRVEQLDGLLGD